MKVRIWIVVCLVCVLPPTLRWFQTSALAQTGLEATTPNDEVPPAALLTDRGAELAQQLRLLRRSESNLGAKHPSLPELRQQIADVTEQLKAWQPAPNPFRRSELQASPDETAGTIPAMNETDLRQIVLILAQEVRDLNSQLSALHDRVRKLERQSHR